MKIAFNQVANDKVRGSNLHGRHYNTSHNKIVPRKGTWTRCISKHKHNKR